MSESSEQSPSCAMCEGVEGPLLQCNQCKIFLHKVCILPYMTGENTGLCPKCVRFPVWAKEDGFPFWPAKVLTLFHSNQNSWW